MTQHHQDWAHHRKAELNHNPMGDDSDAAQDQACEVTGLGKGLISTIKPRPCRASTGPHSLTQVSHKHDI